MPTTHIKGLDGLRGIAAIAVFLTHYDQIVFVESAYGYFDLGQLFENGKFAVALFFILSGYLLSQPYWEHLLFNKPRPHLKPYLLHRIGRILPAYYLCLSAILILNDEWRFILVNPDILLHYLFLFNLTEFSIFSINSVFWTIAVEMQFYLLLPFLFRVLAIYPSKAASCLSMMIIACFSAHTLLMNSFSLTIPWLWDKHLSWVKPQGAVLSHSLLAHLPHFLLGLFAAWLTKKYQAGKYLHLFGVLFWLAALLLIITLSSPLLDYLLVPHGRYGFPLIPLLLVIIVLTTPLSSSAITLLESTAFKTLGRLSYGIYLYHLPLLNYLYTTMQSAGYDATEHKLLFASSGFCLSLFTAYLSYRFFERPLLNFIKS